jgi:RNA polymerase sigma factor for flagellar operon FliA
VSTAATSVVRISEIGPAVHKNRSRISPVSRKRTKLAAVETAAKIIDTSRRDALIVEHLQLVTAIAVRVHETLPVHVELDDLIHAGVMGLFDAATKYEEDKMVAFPAYAKHRIKGAILDSLRQLDCASRDLRRRHRQMEVAVQELTKRFNRTPFPVEIAAEMGLTVNRWRTLMIDLGNLGLLSAQNHAAADSEERPAPEIPCKRDQHPDQVFARGELRSKLSTAMKSLPRRYQEVVTLYYDRDMTMKEIGTVLGVNESRVSQIHKSALARMQSALTSSGIESSMMF